MFEWAAFSIVIYQIVAQICLTHTHTCWIETIAIRKFLFEQSLSKTWILTTSFQIHLEMVMKNIRKSFEYHFLSINPTIYSFQCICWRIYSIAWVVPVCERCLWTCYKCFISSYMYACLPYRKPTYQKFYGQKVMLLFDRANVTNIYIR